MTNETKPTFRIQHFDVGNYEYWTVTSDDDRANITFFRDGITADGFTEWCGVLYIGDSSHAYKTIWRTNVETLIAHLLRSINRLDFDVVAENQPLTADMFPVEVA